MKKVDNKKKVVEEIIALPEEAKVEKKPALKTYKAKVVVNVRFEPSMTSNVIGAVARGEVIEALEEKDGWIRFINGWTKKEFYTEI
jgi:uncharacterized protein YgiM (DUF1202 family)